MQLVAPTTPRERALRIAETSTGFLYYVSVTGITGERTALPQELLDNLRWLRGETDLPICVGFGISTARACAHAGPGGRRSDRRLGRRAARGRSRHAAARTGAGQNRRIRRRAGRGARLSAAVVAESWVVSAASAVHLDLQPNDRFSRGHPAHFSVAPPPEGSACRARLGQSRLDIRDGPA